MEKHIKIFLLLCVMISAPTETASAKEVKFEASIDRKSVAIGEATQLGLTFYGTTSIPAPDIGNIDGLEVRYLGPSTMMTVINGKVSTSITHMYSVAPLRIGKFQLGPFSFKYKGSEYASNMVFLEVAEERPVLKKEEEETPVIERLNLGDRIFLTLDVGKKSAYVNELIPVVVKLYVNRLNVSDITLPAFAQEGFSKVEFKEPKQYRENIDSITYDVLEFKTNIFGTRPGDYRIAPATIKCNLMVKKRMAKGSSQSDEFFGDEFYRDSFFEDFFTRYERHPIELKSQGSTLIVSPLPAESRPRDFSGAVGDYQFIFNANPKKVKVGDPITLTMEINGSGNFNTVLIPKLESTEGFKVYEPQTKTEANKKEFVQVFIPETDQVTQFPKASFNYFDPNKGQYKTIQQGPIPIEVQKAKEEAPAQIVGPVTVRPIGTSAEREELARDIIYIKESPGRLVKREAKIYKNNIFLISLTAPLLFLISFYIFQARKKRLKQDAVYAGRLSAFGSAKKGLKKLKHQLKSNDARAFYETTFKTLQDYLGYRLSMPPAGITYDAVYAVLQSKDVDLNMLRKVKNLFEMCDELRFSSLPKEIDEFKMRDDWKELEEMIRYFERIKL